MLGLSWALAACQPDPCLDPGSADPSCQPSNWIVSPPITDALDDRAEPALETATIEVPGIVGDLVSLADGGVMVGTSTGVYLADDRGIFEVDLYVESTFADEGAVHAMAMRPDGGILVASEAGLLHTYDWALLPSPADELLDGVTIQHVAVSGADGTDELVWIGTDEGLYRLGHGQMVQIHVDGWSTAPDALVASSDRVLVAWSDQIYELLEGGDRWQLVLQFAPVVDLVLSAGVAWARTAGGLVGEQADGQWRLHTLSGTETPAPVHALTDGAGGSAWVAAEAGLGHLDGTGGSLKGMIPQGVQVLEEDAWGDLWAAAETELTVYRTGQVIGFEAHIGPTLDAFCNGCHLSGAEAPLRDFSDYGTVVSLADTIIEKIGTGLMPPAPIPSLDEESWERLVRWYSTGQSP